MEKQVEKDIQYLVTDGERAVVYNSLISKIYRILKGYEDDKSVDEDRISWIILEVQTYNSLHKNELAIIPHWLSMLFNKELGHEQIRKIVLDCTNHIQRLI